MLLSLLLVSSVLVVDLLTCDSLTVGRFYRSYMSSLLPLDARIATLADTSDSSSPKP